MLETPVQDADPSVGELSERLSMRLFAGPEVVVVTPCKH
jgi:hypothetical protein